MELTTQEGLAALGSPPPGGGASLPGVLCEGVSGRVQRLGRRVFWRLPSCTRGILSPCIHASSPVCAAAHTTAPDTCISCGSSAQNRQQARSGCSRTWHGTERCQAASQAKAGMFSMHLQSGVDGAWLPDCHQATAPASAVSYAGLPVGSAAPVQYFCTVVGARRASGTGGGQYCCCVLQQQKQLTRGTPRMLNT